MPAYSLHTMYAVYTCWWQRLCSYLSSRDNSPLCQLVISRATVNTVCVIYQPQHGDGCVQGHVDGGDHEGVHGGRVS